MAAVSWRLAMSAQRSSFLIANNGILAALPRHDYRSLFENLESTQFARGRVIYDLGNPVSDAYFITGGMASLLSVAMNDSTTQVAMVSTEGLLGIPAILGTHKAP